MAIRAQVIFQNFDSYVSTLDRTRSRMENLLAAGLIPRRDIEHVYEGLYLSAFTRFEVLIEQLFFGLLSGRVVASSCGAILRVQIGSDRVAREVVHRDRRYVDWLPYDRTEVLAKAFLRGGRPFTKLSQPDKNDLAALLVTRHAIAHKSASALDKFTSQVIGTIPLSPRERTPAGFLRSQFRISPVQTRFELCMQQMRGFANTICS